MASTTTSFDQLQNLLRELFQFDRADLDFGIYRIMNQRRDEIDRFLAQDLLPQVQQALGDYSEQQRESVQAEMDTLAQQLRSAEVDPESSPKYQTLKRQLDSHQQLEAVEAEVYSDLYTFFSRYYAEGDFISKRRYKAGVYAIPYEGEEIKLHWANADQYYVKTTEDFQDYRFTLSDGRQVHFRLVAAGTERDNNRPEQGQERRFALREKEPVAEVDGQLEVYFEYRPNRQRQSSINEQTVSTVLADPAGRAWRDALGQTVGEKTLLEKHVHTYTAKNTFDYFIHKDLRGFLRRELDFFLKNEVAHLDDLESADAPQAEQYLARLRAIRRVGHKIIDFLAQLEEFQRKLYTKKKFVLSAHYCFTLDRIPADLHEQIVANDAQWQEWDRLYAIGVPVKAEERRALINEQPHLMVDTQLFDLSFKQALLSRLEFLDSQLDGLLINSENFQAIRLLTSRYEGKVQVLYLDPPYNTDASEIIYKNGYKHSSWLSLMQDRLLASSRLQSDTAITCITIDDVEVHRLRLLIDDLFGIESTLGVAAIRSNPSGRSTARAFSIAHEYAVFIGANESVSIGRLERSKRQLARYSERDDKGAFEWVNFRKHGGGDANRSARPSLFYPIYVRGEAIRIPDMTYDRDREEYEVHESPGPDEEVVYPINNRGQEKRWKWGIDRVRDHIEDFTARPDSTGATGIYMKARINESGTLPLTWWDKREYSATEYGTNLLARIMGDVTAFSFPKSVHAVEDCLRVAKLSDGEVVLDYFAGSGTTGHAVINMNQKDGGSRKYILVDMGEYFGSTLKTRLQRAIYSSEWRDGVPVSRTGSSHAFKYLTLESYEDSLANIELQRPSIAQQTLLENSDGLREDYMLRYLLDVESSASLTRLDIEQFADPFDYQIVTSVGGETKPSGVDLPETFNWLLGLEVDRVHFEDGFQTVEGTDPAGQRVLVIWRNLTDERHTNEQLEAFFKDQGYVGRPVEQRLDHVYVNGDCTLSSLKSAGDTWQLHLTEEAFKRLMFELEEVR